MVTSQNSPAHRNIIRDIVRWKLEYERASGNEMTDNELTGTIEELSKLAASDLRHRWFTTVGEWVLSRNDIDIPDDNDPWIKQQFELMTNGQETAYGFTVNITLPPESEL